MPIYEFVCGKCGHKFENITPLSNALKTQKCPECGKAAGERILSVTSVGSSSSSYGGGSCGPTGFG